MATIPFKAVAVDMDGTFVKDDLTYDHQRFDKVLTRLHKYGIHFIASSGRPLSRLKQDFADFLDRIDIIADSGAILVQDNHIIFNHYLTQKQGIELIQFIQDNYPQAYICVSGKDGSYYLNSYPTAFKQLMDFYYPDNVQINNFDEMPIGERVIKLTINATAELAATIEEHFNRTHSEQIHCTTSGFDDTDVLPYGINKARALKYFLQYFKLDSSQLIAFGDSLNDKEMLELAGFSYAMANGNPEIIELAKYTAPSNNENGVLQVLENYLNQDEK